MTAAMMATLCGASSAHPIKGMGSKMRHEAQNLAGQGFQIMQKFRENPEFREAERLKRAAAMEAR